MSSLQFIGTPETIVSVSPDAPAGMPVDEITCAVARADAVITMVMMALNDDDGGRIADSVLSDALWGVQCQLELIKKMACHAHSSTLAAS